MLFIMRVYHVLRFVDQVPSLVFTMMKDNNLNMTSFGRCILQKINQ